MPDVHIIIDGYHFQKEVWLHRDKKAAPNIDDLMFFRRSCLEAFNLPHPARITFVTGFLEGSCSNKDFQAKCELFWSSMQFYPSNIEGVSFRVYPLIRDGDHYRQDEEKCDGEIIKAIGETPERDAIILCSIDGEHIATDATQSIADAFERRQGRKYLRVCTELTREHRLRAALPDGHYSVFDCAELRYPLDHAA